MVDGFLVFAGWRVGGRAGEKDQARPHRVVLPCLNSVVVTLETPWVLSLVTRCSRETFLPSMVVYQVTWGRGLVWSVLV